MSMDQSLKMSGECLLELERYSDAELVYSRIITESKNAELSAESLYRLGWSEYKSGNRNSAKLSFIKFISDYPENDLVDLALYWLGECQYEDGENEVAQTTFTTLLRNHPDSDKRMDADLCSCLHKICSKRL